MRRLRTIDARSGQSGPNSTAVSVWCDIPSELGVAVAPARIDRKPITGDRWLTRWGISIQELL